MSDFNKKHSDDWDKNIKNKQDFRKLDDLYQKAILEGKHTYTGKPGYMKRTDETYVFTSIPGFPVHTLRKFTQRRRRSKTKRRSRTRNKKRKTRKGSRGSFNFSTTIPGFSHLGRIGISSKDGLKYSKTIPTGIPGLNINFRKRIT